MREKKNSMEVWNRKKKNQLSFGQPKAEEGRERMREREREREQMTGVL